MWQVRTGGFDSRPYRNIWRQLASNVDIDGSGTISREEFRQAMTGADTDRMFDEIFRPSCEIEYDLGDLDGDGRLGLEEFSAIGGPWGAPPALAAETFGKLTAADHLPFHVLVTPLGPPLWEHSGPHREFDLRHD